MSDDTFRRMAARTTQELTTALAEAQAEIARLRGIVDGWSAPDPFLCECGMSMPCMDPHCQNPLRRAALTGKPDAGDGE